MTTLAIKGLERVLKKLGELEGRRWLRGALGEAAETLKDYLAEAPPRSDGPVQWASERQRRWYWAARAEQGLPLRYTREADPWSERLGASWTTEVAPSGLSATVGNDASYGPWVQDEERQQPMHRATGWRTIQGAIRDRGQAVIDTLRAELRRVLRG